MINHFLLSSFADYNEDVTDPFAAVGRTTTIGPMELRVSLAISGTTVAIGRAESTVAVTAVTGSAYLES